MGQSNHIQVEVVYADLEKQHLISLQVAVGSTIETAIRQSGILDLFPDIDLSVQKVGVFSHPRALSSVLSEGDRVEIYRPLTIDPKEARRTKAKKIAKIARRQTQERNEAKKR